MANLRYLRTMLATPDLDATIAFYEALGFSVTATYPEGERPTWCNLTRDGVSLMFTLDEPHDHGDGEAHTHEPALSGCLYVNVDDVDALAAELDGRVAGGSPVDQPWGMRELVVRDPNGYAVIFGTDRS